MKKIEKEPIQLNTNTAYDAFLCKKLERSLKDIQNGRVMTIQESKRRLKEKYADFIIR